MKCSRIRFITNALAVLFIGSVAVPGSASAASVWGAIEDYIEATGGGPAQEAIRSSIQKGVVEIQQFDIQAGMTLYYRDGDFKSVIEIEGMGELLQGVTDGVVWSVDPMQGSRILEGAEAQSVLDQSWVFPLLNWKDLYPLASTSGTVNGTTQIKLINVAGRTTENFFDVETGLLTRIEGAGPMGDMTIRLEDYKKVGDVVLAHTRIVEGGKGNAELRIDEVVLNPDLDDKTFEMPAEILALLPAPTTKTDDGDLSVDQIMTSTDTNGDGKISYDEASSGEFRDNFGLIDSNDDGFVDPAELKVAMAYSQGE